MNLLSPIARKGAVFACLLVAGLLAGCGGSLHVTTPEVDDAAAISSASSFHVKPIEYDFQRNPDWEISDGDWPTKQNEWTTAFQQECATADRPVSALAAGSNAGDGAVVEFTVTDMNLGTYAYFYKAPGWIRGQLTITDAKSGNVIFSGTVDSPGTTDGFERFSYEGRVKVAHLRVARDVRWLINRQPK